MKEDHPMIESLGHVVIKVRDLKVAEHFYAETLGLPIQSRSESEQMTFFTLGQHHDFAIIAIGGGAGSPAENAVGTHHIAFKVSGGLNGLRKAKARLESEGVAVAPVDHHVTKSLYFSDPDGNALELYVDGADEWKTNPDSLFTPVRELKL
jgi:catechol 2,3-dioxygenase